MNATRKGRLTDDDQSVAPEAQSTPRQVFSGTADHSFTLQAVMELTKTVSELKATIATLKESVDKVSAKVDSLVAWKNVIFGGAIVVGALVAGGWALTARFGDYVTIKAPAGQAMQSSTAPTLPAQAAPSDPPVNGNTKSPAK